MDNKDIYFCIENTAFTANYAKDENIIQIQSYNKKYTVSFLSGLSSIDFDERSSSEGFAKPKAEQNLDSTPRISKLRKGNPVLNTSTDDLGFTAPPVPIKPSGCTGKNLPDDKIIQADDFIIIDENVHKLYPYIIGSNKHHIFVASEETKTMDSVLEILDKLIALQFTKKNKLIVIGGGITQDVGGFVATIYKRGVDWVLIPTTLLSMADSAIGGKVCINRKHKNIISLFNAPNEIYISDTFLTTLPEHDIVSGIGEALKLALIGGDSCYDFFVENMAHIRHRIFRENPRCHTFPLRPFGPKLGNVSRKRFEPLEKRSFSDRSGSTRFLQIEKINLSADLTHTFYSKNYINIIKMSVCIKRAIIEYDELEKYERKILNYGHTFGHALESTTNYFIPHGIAVLYGMYMINRLFYGNKFQDINTFILDIIPDKYKKIEISYAAFIQNVLNDKKNNGDKICFILLEELGRTKMVYHKLNEYMNDSPESLEHDIKTILQDLFIVNT